jgi:holin-like protein
MLPNLALLLVFQVAGEALRLALALPVPGPVLGLIGLLIVLIVRGRMVGRDRAVPDGLDQASTALLSHLSLLFVPAGVGVMTHVALLASEAVPIGVALVGSSLGALAVAGVLMARLERARP